MAKSIQRSTGSVFRDLGLDAEEAENLRIRAKLIIALTEHLKSRRITQARAARLLGVTQPRISDLVRGKIQCFSVDSLIELLGRAGLHVEVTTRKGRRVA